MAELHNETESSVRGDLSMMISPDFDVNQSSSTIEGGSQQSEVNNDQRREIMSVTNLSNNFKTSYGSSNLIPPTDTSSMIKTPETDDNSTDETQRKNLKNKQLAQNNLRSNSNNTTKKDQSNEAENSSTTHNNVEKNGLNLSEEGNAKQVVKRRGIRFPKDTPIRSYFDPPDPWKNAPAWTTDDLIAEYKKSCDIHGTKPVVKILQQLHTVSTPGKREESFVLKGEKLDLKQVECIEEVLRRVQFQLVDLEGSHLDDESAGALFDMIEYYESACQLNISSNRNIGARGWQSCSRLVRRTPTLNYLDIRNCDLNERTIPIFGRALKMGCHLTILHMENMTLSGRPLIILVAALKMNETLQELFLAENKLMPTDGVQLGNLMRYNHKLNLLDLRKNLLQDVGVSHLCDGLIEQIAGYGLTTLVLWNNQITYQAMPSLGRVLAASQSLETLNIGHNTITNEGIHLLKDGLLKTNSLLRIGLQGTGVSDEGGVALAEFIADSVMLLRIDLRDNEIKTGGLMALSHAMRVNSSVTRIDLDKDTKKESVIKDYAEQQSRLLRDILTFQQRNIQTAIEREDKERAELERIAVEAAEARERKQAERENDNLPELNMESFTVISEEIESTDAQQSEQANKSDVQKDNDFEKEEAVPACETTTPMPSVTLSEGEHHSPAHQRPNLLLPRKKLQPQESLDSPQPAPSHTEIQSESIHSNEGTPTRTTHHPNLPLVIPGQMQLCTNTPAEMLLSPQYYPKQLVRKIFSVTHVSEDSCSSLSSPSSDYCHGNFDPLNVCSIPQDDSSTECLIPSLSTPSLAADVNSTSVDAIISPSSLVRDMADETVKQIVTFGEDDPSEDTTTSLRQISLSSDNSASDEDSWQTSSNRKAGSLDACIPSDSKATGCDSEMPLCQSDEMDGAVESSLPSQNFKENSNASQVVPCPSENDSNYFESSHLVSGKDTNPMVNLCEEAPTRVLPMMNKDVISSITNETTEKNTLCFSNANVPVFDEKEAIADSLQEHCNSAVHSPTTENTAEDVSKSLNPIESLLSDSSESSFRASGNAGEREASCVPSLLSNDTSLPTDACHLMGMCGGRESTPCASRGNDFNGDAEEDTSAKALLKGEPQSSLSETEAVVEIDNVDLSLEEEPWTALGEDYPKAEMGNQPDFFTTLSMNGLTQELASALTSLDGSPLEEDADIQPHDEFERELDAMLADVDLSIK